MQNKEKETKKVSGRELRFRAWDGEDMYVPIIQDIDVDTNINEFFESCDKITVMQYTGLKDKNGKEIYEGDVVCYVDDVVVENIGGYDRTEPEGKFVEVKIPDFYNFTYYEVGVEDIEVIGNIYENPELLTDK